MDKIEEWYDNEYEEWAVIGFLKDLERSLSKHNSCVVTLTEHTIKINGFEIIIRKKRLGVLLKYIGVFAFQLHTPVPTLMDIGFMTDIHEWAISSDEYDEIGTLFKTVNLDSLHEIITRRKSMFDSQKNRYLQIYIITELLSPNRNSSIFSKDLWKRARKGPVSIDLIERK